jgi:hypothetical protein
MHRERLSHLVVATLIGARSRSAAVNGRKIGQEIGQMTGQAARKGIKSPFNVGYQVGSQPRKDRPI